MWDMTQLLIKRASVAAGRSERANLRRDGL
jgi:hypothetical protein